jgi:phosphohistidine phosphatase
MNLYLVQHGDAQPKDVDPERPLTDGGADDVKRVAAFLRPRRLEVEAVWHSGKTRARQTAELLGEALHVAGGVRQQDGLAPNDPVDPIGRQLADRGGDLMIVGHMPFMSRLASLLLAGGESAGVVTFQKGGVLCLGRDEGAWSVRWMVVPQLLA